MDSKLSSTISMYILCNIENGWWLPKLVPTVFCLFQIQSRFGPDLVQIWSRFGPDSVQTEVHCRIVYNIWMVCLDMPSRFSGPEFLIWTSFFKIRSRGSMRVIIGFVPTKATSSSQRPYCTILSSAVKKTPLTSYLILIQLCPLPCYHPFFSLGTHNWCA